MDIPAIAFDSQVGGHSGIRSSADGSVIIKPALPVEVDFYTTLSSSDALTHLFPFVPRFYGTLKLQGQLDEQGNITSAPQVEEGSKDVRIGGKFHVDVIIDNSATVDCTSESHVYLFESECSGYQAGDGSIR